MSRSRVTGLIAATAAGVLAAGVALAATEQPHRTHPASSPAARPEAAASQLPRSTPTRHGRNAKVTRSPRPRPTRAAVSRPLFPLPARPAWPTPCPPPPIPPGPPFHRPKPAVPARLLPAPVPVGRHHVNLDPVRGKGMWLTTWQDTAVDVGAVVAQARAAGLHQLWVRTGGTLQGWYGATLLRRLLPAAHAAGLSVIAWDFPTLSDPLADVARAAKALRGSFGGQRIDAFSADLETIYEGTFDTSRRVRVYLSRVRQLAGDMPVVATVLRPTAYELATYPYRAEAPYVDVFAPMVYWSCNEPGQTARASYRPLAQMRPVHLIGQAYNMGPEGGRHGLPTAREIWRFLDAARRVGAIGASLYDYETARAPQWRALRAYPWVP